MSTAASCLFLRFGELSSESRESSGDEYSEIVQRWKDMAAFEGHSAAEKYAYGRISFVCDVHVSFLGGEINPSPSASNDPFGNRECFASFVYVADIPNPLPLQLGNDDPMFVHNVETVKLPDGVTIPSLVGLYDLHDIVENPSGALCFNLLSMAVLS